MDFKSQSFIDRRMHPRHYDHNATVQLRLNEPSSKKTILAADVDTSDSGMGVLTHDLLEKGNVVNVWQSNSMQVRRAKVVWVREYCQDLYKVGINIIQ